MPRISFRKLWKTTLQFSFRNSNRESYLHSKKETAGVGGVCEWECGNLMEYLPDELIYEVLLRLPKKSSVRFRSLSKSWKDHITDPSFVVKYARQRFGRGKPTTLMLIHDKYDGVEGEIVTMDAETVSKPVEHIIKKVKTPCKFIAISYSLGIFCVFRTSHHVAVWNLATRSTRMITFRYVPDVGLEIEGFGFGHFCNDGMIDLKIVWLVNVCCGQGRRCRFQMYTLWNEKWHWAKPSIAADGFGKTAGAEVNGVLHWIGKDSMRDGDLFILTFDLNNETCGRIELPKGVDSSYECRKELQASLDVQSPSLVLICAGHQSVDLWILKKYGNGRSWVRHVVVVEPGIQRRVLGYCDDKNQTIIYKYKKRPAGVSVSLFNYVKNDTSLDDCSWTVDLLSRCPK